MVELHKHVVAPAPLAVHADGDLRTHENGSERGAGELRAQAGVEDRQLAVAG